MAQTQPRKQYPFLTLDPVKIPSDLRDAASPGMLSPNVSTPSIMSPGALSPSSYFSPQTSGLKSATSPRSPFSPGFQRILHRAKSLTSLGSKKKRIDSGIASRIPPELWLKIFVHIPLYMLPNVTLTCRIFRSLAQPMLFSSINTLAPGAKSRKRLVESIEFFFSPRIAPSVVECCICPSSPEEDHGPTDELIDNIFASLPLLPNLKALNCRYVRLTPQRLMVLQTLQLTTISLEMCFGEISDFVDAPSVPLQAVTFKYPDEALRRDMANPCLLFLSPQHLQKLHATTTSILPTLAQSEPFRKLRTLDIPIESVTSDLLVPALARCPAVEHLSFHTAESIPHSLIESLPEGVLPSLTSYSGPHHYAAAFLRGRNAQRVEINVPSKAQNLASSLKGLDRGLASLSFPVFGAELPAPLLSTVHLAFPALKSLAIREPALSSADINGVLGAVAPHYTLEDVTLHIQGRDKFNLWIPPEEAAADAASCFKKTLPALMKTYPALKVVRFLHGSEGARVMWRRSSTSGLFVQVSA